MLSIFNTVPHLLTAFVLLLSGRPVLVLLMSVKSLLLNFSVPPLNLPTAGPPTPRSLLPVLFFGSFLSFSRMMPFSLASCLLLASRSLDFAAMPLRCAMGMLRCSSTLRLEPSARMRSSAISWRGTRPFAPEVEESRLLSEMSRCRARSCLRLRASSDSSLAERLVTDVVVDFKLEMEGGLELWAKQMCQRMLSLDGRQC